MSFAIIESGAHTGTWPCPNEIGNFIETLRDLEAVLKRDHELGHLMHGKHREAMRDSVVELHRTLQVAHAVRKRSAARNDDDADGAPP